jgi:hypothetical protein
MAQQHKWKPSGKIMPKKPLKARMYKGHIIEVKINPYYQDTLLHTIPLSRTLFHDKIDKEQIAIDKADGIADTIVFFKRDTAWSSPLSLAFLDEVDAMQVLIENMPPKGRDEVTDNQQKIRYLKAVSGMLQRYRMDPKPDPKYYVALVENMDSLLRAVNEKKENEFTHDHLDIYTLDNSKDLFESRPDLRALLYIKIGKQFPVMIVKRLNEFADKDFAGDIIADAAGLAPLTIYYFATSNDIALKKAVYNTDDSLVHCLVNIVALSRAPLKALPFLPDLYHNRFTIRQIDSITLSPIATFENLVRLKLENDSIGRDAYTSNLAERAINYVRKLDELHEQSDNSRFKFVDSLSAPALFFIMVYGQDEIYTSSFLGAYRRMIDHMAPLKGDQFIDSLHYNHFRTFIRMCAAYNTLSNFLSTMNDTARSTLMSKFIADLGKGAEDDLDDAVDVANALGSITDSTLLAFLQIKVKHNYELAKYDGEGNKKGMAVYAILDKLIESANASGNDPDAETESAKLSLPPINKVLYKDLVSESGPVYQQVFFYGDKDGRDAYESFMEEFKKNKNWKVDNSKYWSLISSVSGKKIIIYANLPLKEPEDDIALNRLSHHLDSLDIHPTIMIHRGHSYHLPRTLEKLTDYVKIVILGSCGGYQNLAIVLDHAPDAHIVSSKQTGVRAVNEPIIRSLNQYLLSGDDISWIAMWRQLTTQFNKNPDVLEKFSDYVPPHKNLGAIFIKAYRKMNQPVEQ